MGLRYIDYTRFLFAQIALQSDRNWNLRQLVNASLRAISIRLCLRQHYTDGRGQNQIDLSDISMGFDRNFLYNRAYQGTIGSRDYYTRVGYLTFSASCLL